MLTAMESSVPAGLYNGPWWQEFEKLGPYLLGRAFSAELGFTDDPKVASDVAVFDTADDLHAPGRDVSG